MSTPSTAADGAAIGQLVSLLELGQLAQAQAFASEARRQCPDSAELARLHGIALLQLRRHTDAAVALERAAQLAPHSIEVQCNLATLELTDGRANAAIERLRAALRRAPGHPAILLGLGNALMAAARHAQARESYVMATHGAPSDPGLRLNLAAAELQLGHFDKAELHASEAIQLAPSFDAAYALLGRVRRAQGRTPEAAQAWLRAEQLAPENPEHPFHAGLMLDEAGELALAAQAYSRALKPGPTYGGALSQLVFIKRRLCDWQELDTLSDLLVQAIDNECADVTPFALLAESIDGATQRLAATTFARGLEQRIAPLRQQLDLQHEVAAAGAPIRVGFVADGFGEHATGALVVGLFEALASHSELEIQLFATAPSDHGPIRQRLEAAAPMLDLSRLTHAQSAHVIQNMGIEVLFDLTGYCGHATVELFALRPAPVQVNWLAYPGTSGAPWIDYILADAVVIPDAQRGDYTEQVLRLPRCFQPNDRSRVPAAAPSRSGCGLPASGTVFACFNNSYKINPASFACFMRILHEVPDSVLWLLSGPDGADDRLQVRAAGLGVQSKRLIFLPHLPHADYLARFAHVDLFLDTLPYNAHTTASDALWAGCPLLTCMGETFAGRVAASLLQHLGLPELITHSREDFIAQAIRLGQDRRALASLRGRLLLQHARNPTFDMRGFADDFSLAVTAIGQRHRAHQQPIDQDFQTLAGRDSSATVLDDARG